MKQSPLECQSYWCHCLHCPKYKVAFDNPGRFKVVLANVSFINFMQEFFGRVDQIVTSPNLHEMCILNANPALIKVD